MRKRWLALLLPLAGGIPVVLTASAAGAPAPGVAQSGPPAVLPPCDGVLKVQLKPLGPGQDASDVDFAVCEYPAPGTAADARKTQTSFERSPIPGKGPRATRGSRNVRQENATGALIGQDFDLTSYRTLLVQWTGSAYGCTTGQTYAIPNVGSALNDRIDSSKSFSGCTRYSHYQNASYTGSLFPCATACSTLGSLNNQTTSVRWSR